MTTEGANSRIQASHHESSPYAPSAPANTPEEMGNQGTGLYQPQSESSEYQGDTIYNVGSAKGNSSEGNSLGVKQKRSTNTSKGKAAHQQSATVLPQKSPRFNAFFVFRVFNPLSTSSFLFHCTMNRTPLSSISGNHRRHHQYTLYQKGLICEAIDGELTPSRIEKQYRIPENSVRYVLSTHKSQPTGVSNPRSDKPKVLTTREQRHIIRIARRDPKITYKNLKIQAGIDCFTDIIYRLLKEKNIINWICKKRSLLTSELAGKRYA